MRNPLEGIRVLDLGISTAGPVAARILGDLGADVIKVEPLEGENTRSMALRFGGTSYIFHVNNYNKRSMALKVQHPLGRDIFLDLVRKSDVVIENFSLGTMDRWGIGFEDCRKVNPSIVFCAVKGFGMSGPMKTLRAFDTVTQALTGMMYSTGEPGTPPLKGGPSVCDLLGAAMSAMAVMSALAARQPGESQFLDTALFDAGALSMLPLWPLARRQGAAGLRSMGNGHPCHAPFSDFACRDGKRIMVAVETDRQWRALAKLLDLPPGWSRSERVARKDDISGRLADWLAGREVGAAALHLQDLAIPAAPIADLAEVAASAQTAKRRMLPEVGHPVYGPMPLIATPVANPARPDRTPRIPQPTLGQQTDEIISGLIGRATDLPALREAGVIP